MDDRSVGFTLVAVCDSIVETRKEGVGIPAKERMRSTLCYCNDMDETMKR